MPDGIELRVWSAGGELYLAVQDGDVRRLALGDTAEAHRLHGLLQQHGAIDDRTSMRLDRMLLAGGGGEGFSWTPPHRAAEPRQQNATPAADTADAPSVGGAQRPAAADSAPTGTQSPHRGSDDR
jgi:hypothetical protein